MCVSCFLPAATSDVPLSSAGGSGVRVYRTRTARSVGVLASSVQVGDIIPTSKLHNYHSCIYSPPSYIFLISNKLLHTICFEFRVFHCCFLYFSVFLVFCLPIICTSVHLLQFFSIIYPIVHRPVVSNFPVGYFCIPPPHRFYFPVTSSRVHMLRISYFSIHMFCSLPVYSFVVPVHTF